MMQRGCGSLTGSRVAGCCGLAIVVGVMEQLTKVVRPYEIGGCEFRIAAWVDNFYAAGVSGVAAWQLLILSEGLLRSRWRLDFKLSSKSV